MYCIYKNTEVDAVLCGMPVGNNTLHAWHVCCGAPRLNQCPYWCTSYMTLFWYVLSMHWYVLVCTIIHLLYWSVPSKVPARTDSEQVCTKYPIPVMRFTIPDVAYPAETLAWWTKTLIRIVCTIILSSFKFECLTDRLPENRIELHATSTYALRQADIQRIYYIWNLATPYIEGCFDIEYTTFNIKLLALISKLTKNLRYWRNFDTKGSTFNIWFIYWSTSILNRIVSVLVYEIFDIEVTLVHVGLEPTPAPVKDRRIRVWLIRLGIRRFTEVCMRVLRIRTLQAVSRVIGHRRITHERTRRTMALKKKSELYT